MNSLRQLGTGLLYAVVSVVLVVGGLSLALAEGGSGSGSPTLQPSPTLLVPTNSQSSIATPIMPTAAPASSATSQAPAATATPQALVITATPIILPSPTSRPYASPRPTSTRAFYPTPFHCGPYSGWVLSYTVQPGDTLFHIATLYRTTVSALQIANCIPGTLILPGERLWVPNVPTVTPGVTVIPTFPTLTAVPTEPLTLTPLPYYTETAVPSNTPNADP